MEKVLAQAPPRIWAVESDQGAGRVRLTSWRSVSRPGLEAAWPREAAGLPPPPGIGLGVLAAALTLNVLSLGLPIVILQVYDRILPNAALDTLSLLAAGLVAVLLLDALLRTARAYITGWNAARFEHAAACRAVDRILAAEIGRVEREPPGVHLDRLQAIDVLRDFYAGQARLILLDLPFVVLFLGLIWFIAGPLVAVPLVTLALLAVAALLVGRLLKKALAERATLDDRRYSFMIEALGGIQTIKGLAMEALMQRRYERLQESAAAATYRNTFLSNLAQGLGSLLSNLTLVAVASVGATLVIAGELTIGGLAASTLLAGRTVQPLLRALGLWTQFQSIAIARERVNRLFEMAPETAVGQADIGELKGAVEFKGVSFSYEDSGAPLLDRVDLKIAPGEVIGISGHTGSGKTSLLMLMMNALKPAHGQVLFDGRDAADFDPLSLRRQIAYLPQYAVLFQGTILENLTLFRGSEAVDESLAAVKLLGLDETIHRLPGGYETKVGDGAPEQLPAGPSQGLALARALAGRHRIILFDEANAAFDSKADGRLRAALAELKGDSTMVLISHRPSLLALADRIFDLKDGKLVERAGEARQAGDTAGHRAAQGAPGAERAAS